MSWSKYCGLRNAQDSLCPFGLSIQKPWFSHLSPLPTTGAYRSVTLLAGEGQDSRLRSGPPHTLAGTLPLSRAVPPDPQGKPSSPHCPVLPSDPFVSWAAPPSPLSLPLGFAKPPTHLRDVRSAPAIKVGIPLLSGGHSFGRGGAPSPGPPYNPPGSARLDPPPFRCPFSYLPLARPMRFAPFHLPQGRLPSYSVSRRPLVITSAPRLVFDLLPALAWKTLFGCLRETSCSRSSSRTPLDRSRTDPTHCVGLY